MWHGFYYQSHRAMSDVDALINLVAHKFYDSNTPVQELIVNSYKPAYKISALKSPFETKDKLKARKYIWNGDDKYWWKVFQFDEIDEELKRDRTQELWTKYGKYVTAAAVAVVLGVGVSQGFNAWTRSQAETSANLYHQALAADDALTQLQAQAGNMTDGYALLARFQLAAAHAAADDLVSAESAYAALAADKAVPALYQQAAQLLAVMNAPAGSDIGALQDSLSSLVEGGPWQPLALELSAALDLQNGDNAAAITKLETLINLAETPNELRQRASRLVQVLNS